MVHFFVYQEEESHSLQNLELKNDEQLKICALYRLNTKEYLGSCQSLQDVVFYENGSKLSAESREVYLQKIFAVV